VSQHVPEITSWSSWPIVPARLVSYYLGSKYLVSYVSWCMGMTDAPALPGTKRGKTESGWWGMRRKLMTNTLAIDAEGLDRLSCNAKSDPSTGKKTLKA